MILSVVVVICPSVPQLDYRAIIAEPCIRVNRIDLEQNSMSLKISVVCLFSISEAQYSNSLARICLA